MSTEENKAIVRRMLNQIGKGWGPAVEELIAPNWVNVDPSMPPLQGHEGAKQLITMFSAALPDMTVTVHELIAEGDTVAGYFTFGGTHRGELMGVAPTGKPVEVTATGMFRVVNGKVEQNRVNFDALGMLQQLGVVPTPG